MYCHPNFSWLHFLWSSLCFQCQMYLFFSSKCRLRMFCPGTGVFDVFSGGWVPKGEKRKTGKVEEQLQLNDSEKLERKKKWGYICLIQIVFKKHNFKEQYILYNESLRYWFFRFTMWPYDWSIVFFLKVFFLFLN